MTNHNQQWDLQFILPSLTLREPVETDYIALVPDNDPRLDASRTGASGQLLTNFVDPFGNALDPVALITRNVGRNQRPTLDDIVAFRNVVAIAALIVQWSRAYNDLGNGGVRYSDSFDLYPIIPTMDNVRLLISSATLEGYEPPDSFRGQCSAEIVYPYHHPLRLRDRTLLDPLLLQWRRRFVQGRKEWKTTALFRSLAIAFQAARAPSENRGTLYDLGTRVVLWVSAFETLVHPGKGGRSDLSKVLNLLSQAPWRDRHLAARRFRIKVGRNRRSATFCEKMYAQLYHARNNFAHGNPVNIQSIFPYQNPDLPPFHSVAPLIYRAALAAHLKLTAPSDRSLKQLITFFYAHDLYERALRRLL